LFPIWTGLDTGQAAGFTTSLAGFPQHFLYLRPERQGHGAFRGIFVERIGWVAAGLQNEFGSADDRSVAVAARLQNETP